MMQLRHLDCPPAKPRLKILVMALAVLMTTSLAKHAWSQTHFVFNHVPIVDGDDTHDPSGNYYKGLYHGKLYGGYSESYDHAQDEPGATRGIKHHSDGLSLAGQVVPRCPSGLTSGCDPSAMKIVVVAIGMSNWTKEICANQTNVPQNTINEQADILGLWPPPIPVVANDPTCTAGPYSFTNKSSTLTITPPDVPINPNVVLVDCAIIGAVAQF